MKVGLIKSDDAFEKLRFHFVNLQNVKEFIKIQNEIFSDPNYDATLHALVSCDIELFEEISRLRMPFGNVAYYLAYADEMIVGITGLYTYSETGKPNECWLAWYGVRNEYRGLGYGQDILEWTMNKAFDEGYEVLRIYTTPEKFEKATKVYEKRGFTSEPYTLEFEGVFIYSIALTDKPLELVGSRFMNFAVEIELSKISIEKTQEIIRAFGLEV